jgi:hypothetical protein
MVRPIFTAGGPVTPAIRVNTDYANSQPMATDEYPGVSGSSGSIWGVALWGMGIWGSVGTPYANWLATQGIGTTASLHMVVRPNGFPVKLNAFDLKFERARGLAL